MAHDPNTRLTGLAVIKEIRLNQLKEFLETIDIHYGQYANTLMDMGYETITDLRNITCEEDICKNMQNPGTTEIKIAHARRIVQYTKRRTNLVTFKAGVYLSKNVLSMNLLLLGDVAVGKTSLKYRLEKASFEPTVPTIGYDWTLLKSNYENQKLQIRVMDPSGQEKYRSIVTQFYRRAHGVAIIFDMTCWKSFQSVIDFWYPTVRESADDNIQIVLVGNKIDILLRNQNKNNNNDQYGTKPINSSELIEQIVDFANKKNIKLFLSSAKTGSCVYETFQCLVTSILMNKLMSSRMNHEKQNSQHVANIEVGGDAHPPSSGWCC